MWWNPDEGTSGRFIMANAPWATLEYFPVWPTDAVASLIWRDADADGELDVATGEVNASVANETVATVRFAAATNAAVIHRAASHATTRRRRACASATSSSSPTSVPGPGGGGGTHFGTSELYDTRCGAPTRRARRARARTASASSST